MLTTIFSALYLLALAGLAWAAQALLRIHCEGFACTGVGVVWLAWALAYGVVLGLGLVMRKRLAATPKLARAVSGGLVVQGVLGLGLVAWWLIP